MHIPIVDWLIARAQRTPYRHLPDYMLRYWLLKPRRWLPLQIRVHHILTSDQDRHFHDHPRASISIILRGGYLEVMPSRQSQPASIDGLSRKCVWRGPGDVVVRGAKDRHKLYLPTGETAWTLFIMWGRRRDWGFHTEGGWVYWREYLNEWHLEDANDEKGA